MANWSVVQSGEIVSKLRADAEFFINPYNEYLSAVMSSSRLQWEALLDVSTRLTSGHTPLRHNLKIGDVHFYTVECIDALGINRPKAKRVTHEQLSGELKRVAIKKGDLLITIKRRIAMAAPILTEPGPAAVNQDVVVMTPKAGWSAAVIAAFLVSRPGQFQALRDATEQMNPYLNVQSLAKIRVPRVPAKDQEVIEDLVGRRSSAIESSRTLYESALTQLTERIGWKPPTALPSERFVRPLSALITQGRADAEFFAPSQYDLLSVLEKHSSRPIAAFAAKAERGVQPQPTEGEVVVIDSKAVRELGVAVEKAERTSVTLRNASPRGRVLSGDVLLNSTGVGTLGRATCYRSSKLAVCDNHVAIIRPDPKVCRPEYLALFLNSPAGRLQTERYQSGSSGQVELYPDAIGKIQVFLPTTGDGKIDLDWQDRLCGLVEKASGSMVEAATLLEQVTEYVSSLVERDAYGEKGYVAPPEAASGKDLALALTE